MNETPPAVTEPKPTSIDIPAKVSVSLSPDAPRKSLSSVILDDLHVNASGLVMFACIAIGIFWPSHKPQFDQISIAAASYLFAASKHNGTNGDGK